MWDRIYKAKETVTFTDVNEFELTTDGDDLHDMAAPTANEAKSIVQQQRLDDCDSTLHIIPSEPFLLPTCSLLAKHFKHDRTSFINLQGNVSKSKMF